MPTGALHPETVDLHLPLDTYRVSNTMRTLCCRFGIQSTTSFGSRSNPRALYLILVCQNVIVSVADTGFPLQPPVSEVLDLPRSMLATNATVGVYSSTSGDLFLRWLRVTTESDPPCSLASLNFRPLILGYCSTMEW